MHIVKGPPIFDVSQRPSHRQGKLKTSKCRSSLNYTKVTPLNECWDRRVFTLCSRNYIKLIEILLKLEVINTPTGQRDKALFVSCSHLPRVHWCQWKALWPEQELLFTGECILPKISNKHIGSQM